MQFEVWLGGSAEKSCEVQQMEIEVGEAAVHQVGVAAMHQVGVATMHHLPSAAAPLPLQSTHMGSFPQDGENEQNLS